MANTRKNREGVPIGDPDGDFDGMPWSSPDTVEPNGGTTIPTEIAKVPRTTSKQWRDYFEPAPKTELPPEPTDEERAAVHVFLDGVRAARQQVDTPKMKHGTLVDPSGRALLGSKALRPLEVQEYIRQHPGSYVVE